jgi:hypothetical protein
MSEIINGYTILVRKHLGTDHLEGLHYMEDNIKMDLKENVLPRFKWPRTGFGDMTLYTWQQMPDMRFSQHCHTCNSSGRLCITDWQNVA